MPKNQFQRPAPVKHIHNVPRHGTPSPVPPRGNGKPAAKAVPAGLPSLSSLLDKAGRS